MLTLGEERSFIVLASVLDLGGSAKREHVLANVVTKDYLVLTEEDRAPNLSRNEPRWRTDLSWIRDFLCKQGYLDGKRRGYWQITDAGKQYFRDLSDAISATMIFQVLSSEAVALAVDSI